MWISLHLVSFQDQEDTWKAQSRKGMLLMPHELDVIAETFILKQQLNENKYACMRVCIFDYLNI